MKKNLIAIAVAAAVSVPFAASAEDNISVYGLAQVEVGNVNPQASGVNSTTVETDNANGRVGVAATEDLGSGLKGLAKFEFRIDTADGAAAPGVALTGREMLVGLKGGFGQFELGRLKSAYKYAGGVKYDPFVATLLEARNAGRGMSSGAFGQGGFLSNQVGYNSPKLGPIGIRVTYGPSTDDSAYTASVKAGFKMGEAFVALSNNGDQQHTPATNTDYSAVKIGGQLKFAGGAHKISLQYESTETKVTNNATNTSVSVKPKYLFVGYQGNFGKSTFAVQVGSNDSDANDDATYFAVGAFYHFSKETMVFGGYENTDTDLNNGQNIISIGLKKTFK
jgi:predicted porin